VSRVLTDSYFLGEYCILSLIGQNEEKVRRKKQAIRKKQLLHKRFTWN
jgi:hypothetical protein